VPLSLLFLGSATEVIEVPPIIFTRIMKQLNSYGGPYIIDKISYFNLGTSTVHLTN